MKILVIEDEKLLADSIKEMLERKGFRVECVYDGESGAEYAKLGIYDLLILDVMMPQMPEGMTRPENGEIPEFFGEEGGSMPGFGNFASDAETKDVDIANAHISVEIDGGKASGTMDDIKVGAFVTITMNGKGQATNVLVSSMFGFGNGKPTNSI